MYNKVMENRLIENQNVNQKNFRRFERASSVASRKNAFLGASVGWFSYATAIAFISAIVMLAFFAKALDYLQSNPFIGLGLALGLLVLIFIEFIVGPKMNFWVQLVIITLSMILLGIVLLSFALVELLATFSTGVSIDNLAIAKTFGVILLPVAILSIMAVLAYFDLIKIKFVYAIIIFLTISFFFIFILSVFIFNSWINALFPSIGFALMISYMAFDWWLITRYNKAFNASVSNDSTKKEFMKLTIYFGFKLAYDYIYALIYLIRLIRLAKN
ncbi:Hypothetical protein, predicted transmembrane protein [Mycoplasmopsis agalactiae 14628]|uniref:Transmembrane protein n=1 Tax=Mycoplasmopsis agalactiae 14628 TaxID=1110504 RepID=I5D581_MYCAA|nr:hypothetical protein [Mycoplasmopsis agalactiae]EIN14840.1 Hypothetical protein, predicted transmembrane protein [Mycoplasmopsis agalactiae 14628]